MSCGHNNRADKNTATARDNLRERERIRSTSVKKRGNGSTVRVTPGGVKGGVKLTLKSVTLTFSYSLGDAASGYSR